MQNVVTERNLLAVLDFLEAAQPCPPGRGCKGGDADVPTSVIFPYQRPEIAEDGNTAGHDSGTDQAGGSHANKEDVSAIEEKKQIESERRGGDSMTCTCMQTQKRLLSMLEDGIERTRPGRLKALKIARDEQVMSVGD